jgi:hypothetical protein
VFKIYAMNEDRKNFIWEDVRYIGMSKRIEARFAQHLACSDPDQPEKNDWIRLLLSQGTIPGLWCVETIDDDIKKAREREQYWIRYAMSQGAQLFNKQVTYTPEERIKAHQERAEYYAQIQELLQQGHFVKRSVYWYPSSVKGYPPIKSKSITTIGFVKLYVKDAQGKMVALTQCSDAFFDAWIKQYLSVIDGGHIEWTWSDRLQAINAADAKGIDLGLLKGPVALPERDEHPLEPVTPAAGRDYPDLEGE